MSNRSVRHPDNRTRRGFANQRGFTLVELLFVVFLLGILISIAYPYMESAIDQAAYIDCESRLEMVRRAKSSYVIDHLGGSNPTGTDVSVYSMYFPENFDFKCPRSTNTYTEPSNLYAVSSCPYCASNIPEGVKTNKSPF